MAYRHNHISNAEPAPLRRCWRAATAPTAARAPVDAAVQGSSGGAVAVRDIPLAKVSMIVDH